MDWYVNLSLSDLKDLMVILPFTSNLVNMMFKIMSGIRKKLKVIGKDLPQIGRLLVCVDSMYMYVMLHVLVGWRQDRYWEILDGDKLRSFVSYCSHLNTYMYVHNYVTVVDGSV